MLRGLEEVNGCTKWPKQPDIAHPLRPISIHGFNWTNPITNFSISLILCGNGEGVENIALDNSILIISLILYNHFVDSYIYLYIKLGL